MKFVWRTRMDDLASYNSSQVEEIDDSIAYQEFLTADQEQNKWDEQEDEIV